MVLDPFCGCGTGVHAAHKLGRTWIGIDITPLATELVRHRMEDSFPSLVVPIDGWPADRAGAAALAAMKDKYHFQDWAVIEVGARPLGGGRRSKKGGGSRDRWRAAVCRRRSRRQARGGVREGGGDGSDRSSGSQESLPEKWTRSSAFSSA